MMNRICEQEPDTFVDNELSYEVVIVDYCKNDEVSQLLIQLVRQSHPPASISVVDNSPLPATALLDDSLDLEGIPLTYIHRPENIGYSRACNEGVRAKTSHILFLNPDIKFFSDDTMSLLLKKPSLRSSKSPIGVAQKNPDGSFEQVARRVPTIRAIISRRITWLSRALSKSQDKYLNSYACDYSPTSTHGTEVDWLQSSFLLVPRHTWNSLGGFDERYFVFMADVDYGMRCRRYSHPMTLIRSICVGADGIRSSRGGLLDLFKSKSLRIHISDATTFFIRRALRLI